MKLLPVGLASLSELINGNYVYADKTKMIHEMITTGDYYFLLRPAGFGKSLLLSTLEEIFSGNKELFKDLWIGKSDYVWEKHPVIRLNMGAIEYTDLASLEAGVAKQLDAIAARYHVDLSNGMTPERKFSLLIQKLAEIEQVVILIDDHDKLVRDNIDNSAYAEQILSFFGSFYGLIKGYDREIYFVLVVGVSKATGTTIFSGLNNLHDITMSAEHSTMLGYTQQEVEMYFSGHATQVAKSLNIDADATLAKIQEYYDGYRFDADAPLVSRPSSVLNCLSKAQFNNFWPTAEAPQSLAALLGQYPYKLDDILNPCISEIGIACYDVTGASPSALLLQTGT